MNRRIRYVVIGLALASVNASAEKRIVRRTGAQILVKDGGKGKWLNCLGNAVTYDEKVDKLQETPDTCPDPRSGGGIIRPDGKVVNPDAIPKGVKEKGKADGAKSAK
jgi:hypothetical protein